MSDCSRCKDRDMINANLEKLDPRFRLEKAEMRYLSQKGWIMYCGVYPFWADAATPKIRITQDEAVKIQKERDSLNSHP